MSPKIAFWSFVVVAARSTIAMPWDGVQPTQPVEDLVGWTPMPTEAAEFPMLGQERIGPVPGHNIFKRAFSDRLCGSVDGDPERPWTCDYSLATCMTGSGVLGCCYPDAGTSICGFRTTCIGMMEQSSCGAICLSNTLMRKCTESTAPSCVLYTATDGLSVWGCASTAPFTRSIAVNSAVFSRTDATTLPTRVDTSNIFDSPPTSSDSFSTASSFTYTAVTASPSESKKSAPVGAIAGGVVGGLAVIVAGAVGVFFILSRRKKQAVANAAAAAGAPPGQYPPPMAMGGAPMMPPQQQQQQPLMQPSYGHDQQQWNNQVYAASAPMHQGGGGGMQQPPDQKYMGTDLTNQQPYYQANQQQTYYSNPPPQQNAAPIVPPSELPENSRH